MDRHATIEPMTDVPIEREHHWLLYIYLVVSGLALVTLGYFFYIQSQTITSLEREVAVMDATVASTTAALEQASSTNQSLALELERTQADREELEERLEDAEDENEEFRDQIESLTGTIGDLDRLSRLDEELLQKYSRVYFLNENYRPERLTQIPEEWVLEGRKDQYVHDDMWPFLEDMLERAERDDIDLRILSAFRSFDEQNELKGQFTQQYGTGANTFSADQGYSEHQLGTTVDIVDPETAAATQAFAETAAYEWLQDNAHRYGFVLSYPEGNEYYIFEPWHWRFVGEELARDLERDNDFLYEWEQREINDYLLNMFE